MINDNIKPSEMDNYSADNQVNIVKRNQNYWKTCFLIEINLK